MKTLVNSIGTPQHPAVVADVGVLTEVGSVIF